jgi:hypothetical protein
MELKPGARMRSAADTTEVVVVKAPSQDVDLRCGGHPMVDLEADRGPDLPIESGFDEGAQIGKRYADEAVGLELLCTKAGKGSLSLGGDVLQIKGAKPLPSSD